MRVLLILSAFCVGAVAQTERLSFDAEWRLIRAGTAELTWTGRQQAQLKLRSVGLVAKLIRIEDAYDASFDAAQCALANKMVSNEGNRQREADAAYDVAGKKATYLEKDLRKNAVVRRAEIDTPGGVLDVIGALHALRQRKLEPGQSFTLPVSDGKKFINARVECQEKEVIKTKAGTFQTMRCEAFLMNGELYGRKGRLFLWISEDERRLPVQVRVQMPFYIGTMTITLEKVEKL
jgi:hypothetical protein